MPKVALVLSGGGARGAFQCGAERYARLQKGYSWDVIAGVSVGALNAAMLAMGKYERLHTLWNDIAPRQVYTGELNWFWALGKLLFRQKGVLGNGPLMDTIEKEWDPNLLLPGMDLRVGGVSLRTGDYCMFRPQDPGFAKAVLASTSIPLAWPPIDVSPEYDHIVDGGVRNISPLGDVLDTDPDEIVVINCDAQAPLRRDKPFNHFIDVAQRSLDIALNEIFVTDLREFLRINKNVEEAGAQGVTLHNEDGKAYRYYKCTVIQPDEPLGDVLDFSQASARGWMQQGWDQAARVLGPAATGDERGRTSLPATP